MQNPQYHPTIQSTNPNPTLTQPINQPPLQTPDQPVTKSSTQVQQTSLTEKCLPRGNRTDFGVGTITFRPLEAKFNDDPDLAGKHDPYCKFSIGFHRGKTTVAGGQGKNPHWTDAVTLKVKNHGYAKVKVKDFQHYAFNSRFGTAKIPLDSIYTMGKSTKWYPLIMGEKVTGEILVEMEFLPRSLYQ